MNQPPNLSSPLTLFKNAWIFYRRHFKKIVYLALVPVALGLVWRIVLALGLDVPVMVELAILVLINLLTQLIFIDLMVSGGVGSAQESLRRSLFLLVPFIWTTLLTGLAFLGGLTLLVVPGIIVGVWLAFSSFVVAAEKKSGLEALVASWHYVRGWWWEVFGYLLLWGAGLGLILGLVYFVLSPLIDTIIIRNIISLLVSSLILSPLGVAYIFSLYQEIRELKGPNKARADWLIWFIVLGLAATAGLIYFLWL